jgi:hypothetical protein
MTHPAFRQFALSSLNEGHGAKDGVFVPSLYKKERVAIYGAGLGKDFAPLTDPTWEVWCINLIPAIDEDGHLRASRWFDLHQRTAQTENDLTWIRNCPVPIYVPPDLEDGGPNCVRYPLDSVLRRFGAVQFACTFSYQIALALLEGFDEIGLFGLELRLGTERERTVEWASVSWWLGFAAARGVKITVPPGSWLGRHPALYGFEYDEEIDIVKRYVDYMRAGDIADRDARLARKSVGG